MHNSHRGRKLNIVTIGWIPILAAALFLAGCGGGGGGSGDTSNIGGSPQQPYPSNIGTDNPSAVTPVVAMTWHVPNFNEDGSCADDVAGFRFYLGTTSGTYNYRGTASLENTNCVPTDSQTVCGAVVRCTYDVSGLPTSRSDWYAAIQAFDTSGNSSGFSNEIRVAAR